jgi:hypothetical protein
VTLDESLIRALRAGKGKLRGLQPDGKGGFLITGPNVRLVGLLMATREHGNLRVELGPNKSPTQGDIAIAQIGSKGVQGGVTLRLKR